MRIPRSLFLPQSGGGLVHKFWRAHNREFLLQSDSVKNWYLRAIRIALKHKSIANEVAVHAFCVMSNHAHMLVKYQNQPNRFSSFMRIAHSKFGQDFNRAKNRQGPVAYDRPKTPLVEQSNWNQMRVQFYIEANPLRARMVRNLKMYKFSSYSFCAWGTQGEFTSMLTIPKWYLDLGPSVKIRRERYRSLFARYLQEVLIRNPSISTGRFIGDPYWCLSRTEEFTIKFKALLSLAADPPA